VSARFQTLGSTPPRISSVKSTATAWRSAPVSWRAEHALHVLDLAVEVRLGLFVRRVVVRLRADGFDVVHRRRVLHPLLQLVEPRVQLGGRVIELVLERVLDRIRRLAVGVDRADDLAVRVDQDSAAIAGVWP
jgi:hypothetical protein